MCLWPNMDNGNNTIRLLVSLGCALGTNWYYSYISLVISYLVACVCTNASDVGFSSFRSGDFYLQSVRR